MIELSNKLGNRFFINLLEIESLVYNEYGWVIGTKSRMVYDCDENSALRLIKWMKDTKLLYEK